MSALAPFAAPLGILPGRSNRDDAFVVEAGDEGRNVAMVYGGKGLAGVRAEAIVRAVNTHGGLLAALEAMLGLHERLEYVSPKEMRGRIATEVLARAREAIARARPPSAPRVCTCPPAHNGRRCDGGDGCATKARP